MPSANSIREHMENDHNLHEAGSLSEGVLTWLHHLAHDLHGAGVAIDGIDHLH